MATYVTSLHGNAIRAHVGTAHRTACGFMVAAPYVITEQMPPGRVLCARCAALTGAAATEEAARRQSAVTLRDQEIVALLRDGADNFAVARALNIGLRTAVRYINDAQERAEVTTRFQWGYAVGLAEGRT
jgi:DNA-binding NarL/FixJ family response regulator